jgi:putative ABC transport system permease protein
VSPGRARYETDESYVNFFHRMSAQVASLPGVESVALINNAPFTVWNTSNYFTPEGWVPAEAEQPDAEYRTVSRSYFGTMGIRLRKGRLFDRTDRSDSPGVVIVNRALAERYWPGGAPVGRRLTLEDPASGKWLTVIGVVDNVRGSGVRSDPKPMIYRLFEQAPQRFMTVVLQTRGEIDGLPSSVRQAVWQIDKDLPVASFQSMEANLSEALAGERSRTALLGLFALTAMALTGFGVYTLLTHTVNKRLREFGVRLAVGASRRDILAVAMSRGLKVILVGIAVGLFLAVSLARGLKATLYEVQPFDPGVFLTGILLQTVVALLAIYLPSRRAAQVDPASVLRTL